MIKLTSLRKKGRGRGSPPPSRLPRGGGGGGESGTVIVDIE